MPMSVLGALDPTLEVPYRPVTEFPFSPCGSQACGHSSKEAVIECPHTAHFMAICSKLVYEDDSIICSVIQDRYRLVASARLCTCRGPCMAMLNRHRKPCG